MIDCKQAGLRVVEGWRIGEPEQFETGSIAKGESNASTLCGKICKGGGQFYKVNSNGQARYSSGKPTDTDISHVSFLRSDVSEVRAKKERAGFTLVEVIVVIVIIAILAAIGVPALTGYIDKAQDKQYITKARDFAIATRTVIDEAYADGDFSDPKGLMYYNPDFLETSFSPKSNFKVWEIFAVSEFIYNDSARFAYRIADLQGDEDLIYFCEAGGQRLYIAGSLDSNIFNADGFLWMYSPEEIITYNDGVGGDPASFIIVTYKLTRANSLDVDITEENKNKFEPWNMAHLITNEAEYDPDAGYEVYHGHYSGAVY